MQQLHLAITGYRYLVPTHLRFLCGVLRRTNPHLVNTYVITLSLNLQTASATRSTKKLYKSNNLREENHSLIELPATRSHTT